MSHLILEHDHVFTPANSIFSGTWHGLEKHPETNPEEILRDGSNVMECLRPIFSAPITADMSAYLAEAGGDLATLSDSEEKDLSNWKAVIADLRENKHGFQFIHCHKESFAIHQYKKLFDCLITAADQVFPNGYEIATLGTLGNYSQFMVSLAIAGMEGFDLGGGDTHRNFFNLNSSLNGLVSSNILLSSVRTVCMNTVIMAIRDAEAQGTRAAIKHSKNSGNLITPEWIEEQARRWVQEIDLHKQALLSAQSIPMGIDGFRAFAAGVFTTEKSDRISTISFNRVEEMVPLFAKGKGNKGESLYDALNAFTEFFTHGAGVGGSDVRQNKRVASANFGRGNDWKLEALRVAATEETLAATMARGSKMIFDYAIAESRI